MPRSPLLLALLLLGACAKVPAAAPTPPPAAAPTPPPARAELPAADVPLAFDRGLWHLEGTLSLPAREEGARVPAAVIVHGSGPMSRDGLMHGQIGLGFGFELPVYKRLAEALSARGYAVYRYDKRTCGSFNDCAETGPSQVPYSLVEREFATTEYIGDAVAALDAVRARPEIDPDRTFFVGHSEGGELVPVLLSERPAVRAGVMLAPPFHSMAVVLEQQSERVRWSFASAGQPERAAVEGGVLLDAARALARVEKGHHLGGPILGQPPGLWASWLELAARAPEVARRLDRPLLVLGGSYDYNVAPSEIESWARWLDPARDPGQRGPRAVEDNSYSTKGVRTRHRVRVLDCVTHALNCIVQPDPKRITPADIGRDLSPELVREVVTFLDAQSRSG